MARKMTPTPASSIKPAATRSASTVSAKSAPVSTPVRNSAVPPKSAAISKKPAVLTHDAIARRAYEIFLSGTGGSETDNWLRAERELRGSL